MTVDDVFEAWREAVNRAYLLARSDRARELRGDRSVKRFDKTGLHPYSREWGAIDALEALEPGLNALRFVGPDLTPSSLRAMAARDAEREFREAIFRQDEGVFA